jgi:hypothetical protein
MTITIIFSLLAAFAIGYILGLLSMGLLVAGRHHDDEEGKP